MQATLSSSDTSDYLSWFTSQHATQNLLNEDHNQPRFSTSVHHESRNLCTVQGAELSHSSPAYSRHPSIIILPC
jgi:hypothetical protein